MNRPILRKAVVAVVAGGGVLVLTIVASLMTDASGRWDGGGASPQILQQLRIPRLILGMVVGGQLAIAGLLLQTLFRNPLAEPYILGVSSGASLGNVLWTLFLAPVIPWRFGMEISGALGALLAVLIVIRAGRAIGLGDSPSFILVGVAVGAGLHALAALFLVQADPNRIRDALVWLMGSLAYKSWMTVWACLPVLVAAFAISMFYSRGLDLLGLGEESAHDLGLDVPRMRILTIGVAVVLAGSATAAVGVVGFVGLMAPNLIRLHFSISHRWMIPLSAIAGGTLVPMADLLSRYLAPGREIPIGILTSIAGSAFFLIILRSGRVTGRR
jgi:iron complex transport system permease protein